MTRTNSTGCLLLFLCATVGCRQGSSPGQTVTAASPAAEAESEPEDSRPTVAKTTCEWTEGPFLEGAPILVSYDHDSLGGTRELLASILGDESFLGIERAQASLFVPGAPAETIDAWFAAPDLTGAAAKQIEWSTHSRAVFETRGASSGLQPLDAAIEHPTPTALAVCHELATVLAGRAICGGTDDRIVLQRSGDDSLTFDIFEIGAGISAAGVAHGIDAPDVDEAIAAATGEAIRRRAERALCAPVQEGPSAEGLAVLQDDALTKLASRISSANDSIEAALVVSADNLARSFEVSADIDRMSDADLHPLFSEMEISVPGQGGAAADVAFHLSADAMDVARAAFEPRPAGFAPDVSRVCDGLQICGVYRGHLGGDALDWLSKRSNEDELQYSALMVPTRWAQMVVQELMGSGNTQILGGGWASGENEYGPRTLTWVITPEKVSATNGWTARAAEDDALDRTGSLRAGNRNLVWHLSGRGLTEKDVEWATERLKLRRDTKTPTFPIEGFVGGQPWSAQLENQHLNVTLGTAG